MGIHGLLRELGPAPRAALATLSAAHLTTSPSNRPLRLAIDIQIWLFQIQSGRGGSNPALRTFYYRLLRLLSLNIWPLFVFDGPNKPLFKRNKKVGGGSGVRVATVPEFLAKQLLKQFGFPWHVAPGEAEAECAILQREGLVDAVLSEDVDTLMFGSGVTFRNWSADRGAEGGGGAKSNKTPTHVSVYRAAETKERSRGIDREGMILVALMSGGDYLPEGIVGCGPKVACDAARAGFGKELCALRKKDKAGLRAWGERLQHEIRTNESKFFSRRNPSFTIPEEFPNLEVLGYYTHPCVSTPEKIEKLRQTLKWDQEIDLPALRDFAKDAFDWRCLGGAKKFIRNLAPAMLVRELRLRGQQADESDERNRAEREKEFVLAIHGKRDHSSVDNEQELRISFIPSTLVPIDLSIEDEDDDVVPAGGEDSDAESDGPPSSTADEEVDEVQTSPKKNRTPRPFDPDVPEKLWILRSFLQLGSPLLVEEYEASFASAKAFFNQLQNAKAAGAGRKKAAGAGAAAARKKKGTDLANGNAGTTEGAIGGFAKVTKAGKEVGRAPSKEVGNGSVPGSQETDAGPHDSDLGQVGKDPRGVPGSLQRAKPSSVPHGAYEVLDLSDTPRPGGLFARFATQAHPPASSVPPIVAVQGQRAPKPNATATASAKSKPSTPRRSRKRTSNDLPSPASGPTPGRSQRTITSYYSPSPRKALDQAVAAGTRDIISLISSSPSKPSPLPIRETTPKNLRDVFVRSPSPTFTGPVVTPFNSVAERLHSATEGVGGEEIAYSPGKLPDTVTKRRRKGGLKRHMTAPVAGETDERPSSLEPTKARGSAVEVMDLAGSPPYPLRHIGVGGGGGGPLLDDPPDNHAVPSPELMRASSPVVVEPRASSKPPPAPLRRSPRQAADRGRKKKAFLLRQSLEGSWKEIEVEAVDLSGDGSGWKGSAGMAVAVSFPSTASTTSSTRMFRKSGVEMVDMTGV